MISCDRGKHENGPKMMNLASLAIPVEFQQNSSKEKCCNIWK
jgi:hypothetical protein